MLYGRRGINCAPREANITYTISTAKPLRAPVELVARAVEIRTVAITGGHLVTSSVTSAERATTTTCATTVCAVALNQRAGRLRHNQKLHHVTSLRISNLVFH